MSTSSMIPLLCPEEEIIAEKSQNVFINKEGVKKIADKMLRDIHSNIKQNKVDMGKKYVRFSKDFPNCYDYRSADWLFVLNALNFSLYIPKATKQWTVNGFTGYWALCSAISRAIKIKQKPIWEPGYYVDMEVEEMKELFKGDGGIDIRLIDKRLEILHNIGKILIDKYDGTFLTCIKLCKYNAKLLMDLITNEFKCYQDKVTYNEKEVCLNTKAKILINDLRFYFQINTATCVMTSTIFADYRSLNVLNHFDALCYSETFEETFKRNGMPVRHKTTEELELRSCAIVAVKMLCEEVQKILLPFLNNFMFFVEAFNIPFKENESFMKLFNIPILVDNLLFKYLENGCLPDIEVKTEQY